MNVFVFILFLFGLQAICLQIGRRSSKGLKTQNDYFLAGKSIPFFPLMMTFLATQVGGGLILGSAEEAYHYGWSVLFYPLGAAIGLILLGLGLGRKLAQFPVSTVAQIFEVAYRSAALKRVASFLSILSLFMVLVAQIIASNKFMVSLGVENPLLFIAFWGVVTVYTVMGGLKAVIATDMVQAGFFIIIFLLTFGLAWTQFHPSQVFSSGSPDFTFNLSKFYGWIFMPPLFMAIEQDMGQRCFAGDSAKTVSQATFWAGIGTFIVGVIPIFFGILARKLGIAIPEGASVLMMMIKQMNPVLAATVSVAILCTIISTADSLINAISSNLAQDFMFFRRGTVRLSQALSAVISTAALFFSFYFKNVVDVLIQSYALSVSCLFIPIIIVLFKKKGNALSAALAIGVGMASFIALKGISTEFPKEIISILVSLLGYGIGEATVARRQVLPE